MSTTRSGDVARSNAERWATPVFGIAMGIVFFAVFGLRGDWAGAVIALAIMLAYSAVLVVLGRRSETVGLLGGDSADERGKLIQARANTATAYVLITVIIAAFLVEISRGQDGAPWSWLGAVAGLTYIAATAWYARRS